MSKNTTKPAEVIGTIMRYVTDADGSREYRECEIITADTALRRVGLSELADAGTGWGSRAVVWTGTPRPFPCGHIGRVARTQEPCRTNQYLAGGDVLFSWTAVARESRNPERWYVLRDSIVVTVDRGEVEYQDSRTGEWAGRGPSTHLRLAMTG